MLQLLDPFLVMTAPISNVSADDAVAVPIWLLTSLLAMVGGAIIAGVAIVTSWAKFKVKLETVIHSSRKCHSRIDDVIDALVKLQTAVALLRQAQEMQDRDAFRDPTPVTAVDVTTGVHRKQRLLRRKDDDGDDNT